MSDLHFNTIKVTNFLSIGETLEFDFNKHYGLNYCFGVNADVDGVKNGIGKTTLFIEAILFGLYGKTSQNINKKFLAHRKMPKKVSTVIQIDLDVNNKNYIVESGVTGNGGSYMTLLENGLNITKPSITETRKFLETEILRCNLEMFKNSILLSANNSYQFFSLDKSTKRSFIENVFNLTVFGKMLKQVRKHKNQTNSLVLASQASIKELKTHIITLKKENEDFEANLKNEITTLKTIMLEFDSKIQALEKAKKPLEESITNNSMQLNEDIEKKKLELTSINEQTQKINNAKIVAKNKIDSLKHQIDKHTSVINIVCDDCKLKIEDMLKFNILTTEIDKHKTSIEKFETALIALTNKALQLKTELNNMLETLKDKQIKETQLKELNTQLTLIVTNKQSKIDQYNETKKSQILLRIY